MASNAASDPLVVTLVGLGVPLLQSHDKSAPVPVAKILARTLGTPQSAAIGPAPKPVVAPGAPQLSAVVEGVIERFPEVWHVNDASHLESSADRAWTLEVNGCLIFAGQYNSTQSYRDARDHWATVYTRYAPGPGGNGGIVVAIKSCDTPEHQNQARTQIDAVMNSLR
jgi:hypothetical protein